MNDDALPTPPENSKLTRREFFLWAGWFSFFSAVAGYLFTSLRFFFPRVLFEPAMTFKAGYPEEYPIGTLSDRFKREHRTWIIRLPEGIIALSSKCTHLGCTPNWLEQENKFKCPCHGSGFYKEGINFEGPAPRPLERFKITLASDGQILVDRNKVFKQEKGEWDEPDAILRV